MKLKFLGLLIIALVAQNSVGAPLPPGSYKTMGCRACKYDEKTMTLECLCRDDHGYDSLSQLQGCLMYGHDSGDLFCEDGVFWQSIKLGNTELAKSVIKELSPTAVQKFAKQILEVAKQYNRSDVVQAINQKWSSLIAQ